MKDETIIFKHSGQVLDFMVVLVSLVIVFKKQINTLLENIFKQINTKSKEVIDERKGRSYRLPCDDPGDDHDTFAGYGRVSPYSGAAAVSPSSFKFSNGVFDGTVSQKPLE